MLIRRETPADVEAVRAVVAAAFTRREQHEQTPPEVALVEELRASDAWLPALSLVATGPDQDVIGHVLCTRGRLETDPALALGPLSVHPDHWRHGVGSALMHAVLGTADALGEPLVALVGAPGYYARFGFRLAEQYGIIPPVPEWQSHFQIRTLTAYTSLLHGMFTYPRPFERV